MKRSMSLSLEYVPLALLPNRIMEDGMTSFMKRSMIFQNNGNLGLTQKILGLQKAGTKPTIPKIGLILKSVSGLVCSSIPTTRDIHGIKRLFMHRILGQTKNCYLPLALLMNRLGFGLMEKRQVSMP